MMSMVELFSFLGFPARVAGRALLVFRYVSNRGSTARVTTDYAEKRFGKTVRLRPWLTIDVIELEEIDELLNQGSDAQVESWRVNQLSVCGMIAIIGALVAQAALTALQLPGLENVHYVSRGTFTMSLVLSILAVFFSGLQQSSFGRANNAKDLRRWLTSGVRWNEDNTKTELQSSIVSHMILQAPFEIVTMSITLFVVGLGVYLGSSWKEGLPLNTGSNGNRAVLIAFVIPTVFVLLMYGHMMGLKDRELERADEFTDIQVTKTVLKKEGNLAEDLEAGNQKKENGVSLVDEAGPFRAGLKELTFVLKETAEAHRRCARADEEIARQYEKLLRSSSE